VSGTLAPEVYIEERNAPCRPRTFFLGADNTEGACNRAYYAMFDAAFRVNNTTEALVAAMKANFRSSRERPDLDMQAF